jgi:lipopolysaccharide transport system permease protein
LTILFKLSTQKIIIEAGKANTQYWRDVWNFRGLFSLFAWRDILVRYKQTVLGVAWALLRPLVSILAFVFIRWMLGAPTEENGIPYPLMISAGMLAWTFFSSSVSEISNSLVGNSGLISKVYFPRIIIPLSTAVVCFVDFLVSLVIIVGFMFYYQFFPGVQIFLIPVFFVLLLVTALGIGLFFAAFNVKYRDFRYIVPFVVQFGMYVSPVIFSTKELMSRNIPEWLKFLYAVNPMVSIIDGFKWCFFGESISFNPVHFSISLTVCIFFFLVGLFSFRKLENQFADVI